MFKNVSGQKVALFAFDSATGLPATGDAANITAYLSQDFAAVTALTDTSATELDTTNAAGWYLFDVTQGETNADNILFTAKSSTSGIIVVGKEYCTAPPNFTTLDIDGDGKLLLQDDAITADVIADAAIDAATFAAGALDSTAILAIKTKTDQLTFTTANRVDAQIVGMNDNVMTADATAADFVAEINVQNGLLLMFAAKGQTTLRLEIANAAGQDVYFVVWLSDGSQVFDFDDNTFKDFGDATTPWVLANEVTDPAGLGQSWYHGTVDMTELAPGLAPADITVEAFAQNDVTPDPLTDSTLAAPVAKRVRFGMLDPQVSGRVTPIYKRELDTWEADFTVLADGQPVSFDGTAELSVRAANGTLLFAALTSDTITDAVDGLKHLRFTQAIPGFTGDRDYSARVVLTEDAVTFAIQDTFQILA